MDGSIFERLLISVFLPSAKKGRRKSREVNQGSIRKLFHIFISTKVHIVIVTVFFEMDLYGHEGGGRNA